MIELIRKTAQTEEIDYNFLINSLKKYTHPRDKITRLLRQKALIRVKKGLYVFGPSYRKKPYSPEVLANLIYGPSYISLSYALYYYGSIPERIDIVTSITNKRNKFFATPLGNFSYTYLNPHKYSFGITQVQIDATQKILIATKEKAFVDTIYFSEHINSPKDAFLYLTKSLRVNEAELRGLKINKLNALRKIYGTKQIAYFYEAIRSIR